LEEVERRLAAMVMPAENALRAIDRSKGKGLNKGRNGNKDRKCFHCERTGHIRIKCYSWLRDTDEGRKYASEHTQRGKTGPLLTPGAKGNLSPVENAQVVTEDIKEACWQTSETIRFKH
jgi:acetolactate synthase regulatory subunit